RGSSRADGGRRPRPSDHVATAAARRRRGRGRERNDGPAPRPAPGPRRGAPPVPRGKEAKVDDCSWNTPARTRALYLNRVSPTPTPSLGNHRGAQAVLSIRSLRLASTPFA